MYVIGDILVSDEVTDEQFACDLQACKGACCWEGDFGAPLAEEELSILEEIYPKITDYLTEEGRQAIRAQGLYTTNKTVGGYDTPLVDNRACAYMALNEQGMAYCAIERAYNEGVIGWKKPISCHLYPIRVTESPARNFEALNYDRWEICSAACSRGERQKIRVFEFARPALIRKYGEAWYEELVAAVAANADEA